MSEEEKGFEIKDRRKVRADDEGAPAAPEEKPGGQAGEMPREAPGDDNLPQINFLSFIGSLGATALMELGEKISPDHDERKDLPAAKQMIDLIDLIKEKTKGNLEKEESDMLDNLLYNLKVRYVRETTRK